MGEKVQVLDIGIDAVTAKEAMKRTVEYMDTEPVSTIELITVDTLMYASGDPELKESIEKIDLVLPGEKEILKGVSSDEIPGVKRKCQELEQRTYLKMAFRYFHKTHARVFLLVETEEEAESFYSFFADHYGGIQVAGMAKVASADAADDMVINAINGQEPDCVIAALSAPEQQNFIVRNKSTLNARLWLGIGKEENPVYREGKRRIDKLLQAINRQIFKREVEKSRKKEMKTVTG